MNHAQNKAVYALLNKTGLLPQKENIVAGISDGRTTSTRELTPQEAIDLIKYLKNQDQSEIAADVMRKKIISLAHEMGWHVAGTRKADMRRIDEWCKKFGYGKKSLDNYHYNELPKLVSQFESVYKSFLNGI